VKDKAEKQCASMRVSTGSRVRVTVIQLRGFHARRRGKGRLLEEEKQRFSGKVRVREMPRCVNTLR